MLKYEKKLAFAFYSVSLISRSSGWIMWTYLSNIAFPSQSHMPSFLFSIILSSLWMWVNLLALQDQRSDTYDNIMIVATNQGIYNIFAQWFQVEWTNQEWFGRGMLLINVLMSALLHVYPTKTNNKMMYRGCYSKLQYLPHWSLYIHKTCLYWPGEKSTPFVLCR